MLTRSYYGLTRTSENILSTRNHCWLSDTQQRFCSATCYYEWDHKLSGERHSEAVILWAHYNFSKMVTRPRYYCGFAPIAKYSF